MQYPPHSRRRFIAQNLGLVSAAFLAPSWIPLTAAAQKKHVSPNNKIVVGCVGVGPQGLGVMGNFLAQPDVQVVVVCDSKSTQLAEAKTQVDRHYHNTDCATTGDYRELLARRDLDAVLIATPDHWHVPVAVAAARAGKDMYLEKPMGLTVAEDQILRHWLQKKQRIFQFGTQQRSSDNFRLACELVRNQAIGRLKQIDVWCVGSAPGGSTTPVPAPPDLNYDLWLGPAPWTPYTENKADRNNKTWWFNYDYALGFVAGWGVHPLDIAYWGYPQMMTEPLKIKGRGIIPPTGACNTAVAWEVSFQMPQDVTMRYRATPNGFNEKLPMNNFQDWQQKYGAIVDHGTAFTGDQGWVLVDRTQIRTQPENLVEMRFSDKDITLTRSHNHVRNFVDSIKTRTPAICPIEDAVQADVLCHLSDIAIRLERELTWNPDREKFVQDPEANRCLDLRFMRPPWQLKRKPKK